MAGNATPHGACLGLPSRRSQRRPRGPEAEPPGAGIPGCPEGQAGPLSLGGLGGLSLSWKACYPGWLGGQRATRGRLEVQEDGLEAARCLIWAQVPAAHLL